MPPICNLGSRPHRRRSGRAVGLRPRSKRSSSATRSAQQGFISALELERRETALKAQKAQLEQALAQAACRAIRRHDTPRCRPRSRRRHGGGSRTGCGAGGRRARVAPGARRPARRGVFGARRRGGSLAALLGRKGAVQVRVWGAQQPCCRHAARDGRGCRPGHTHFPGKGRSAARPSLAIGPDRHRGHRPAAPRGCDALPLSAVMQAQGPEPCGCWTATA
jgi:hypothetical protein